MDHIGCVQEKRLFGCGVDGMAKQKMLDKLHQQVSGEYKDKVRGISPRISKEWDH